MNKQKLWVAMLVLLAGVPATVAAQTPGGQTPMEEVVVTGTPGGGEMRKLDASYAITNVDDHDIERFSPKSTADLLKTIPGVWSESSGGVAGANVFVRGFPASGDAPFLTVQLEGAPIFPPPTLSFLENTTLFRVDETIERMEGLRGGPQSVQDNGQPGLTTNFILKRGGDTTEGRVKYTTSDYDLQRFDAVVSGPLTGDGLYYMVGGYVSSSPGIKDAGYSSEQGRQFTVKITKELERGSIDFYTRNTDDHGTWYLPAALNVPGVDNSYVQNGTLNRSIVVQAGSANTPIAVDLGDGRGWKGSVSGINFNLDVGDAWSLSDSLNHTSGDANTAGLVPDGGAVNVAALLADPNADPMAVVNGALTTKVTGRALDGSEYLQRFGAWWVQKDIESFTNNLAATGTFERFDVTVGLYTATTSIDEFWTLGNQHYYVVEQGGEMVNGIACNDPAVDSCNWNYDINASGDATNRALYSTLTYRATDQLSLDVGLRSENHQVNYTVDEGDFSAGAVPSKYVVYDETQMSSTFGANYALSDYQGLFGRISKGYKFPWFDDFRDNYGAYRNDGQDLQREVTQYEFGYKHSTSNLSLYVTAFFNEVVGDAVVRVPGEPAVTRTNEAHGVEVDAHWYLGDAFVIAANATIQSTEITKHDDPAIVGKEAVRQPPYQVRISPSYTIGNATLYGAYTKVDDRWNDDANTVVLPGYDKIDLGVLVEIGDNLELQLAIDNATDEDGLTEGDPREPTAPNGRFIMPRSVKAGVAYNF